ncbi:hypothetical protein MNBD_NITROSPINAE03-1054 [hydrothermal vent metagenome]|uniref:Uncharacterized protein n=1 Tax=hydrothermal vent metagenome TaxID=652676 RepID=A0A3B1CHK6_9ZZZZ
MLLLNKKGGYKARNKSNGGVGRQDSAGGGGGDQKCVPLRAVSRREDMFIDLAALLMEP